MGLAVIECRIGEHSVHRLPLLALHVHVRICSSSNYREARTYTPPRARARACVNYPNTCVSHRCWDSTRNSSPVEKRFKPWRYIQCLIVVPWCVDTFQLCMRLARNAYMLAREDLWYKKFRVQNSWQKKKKGREMALFDNTDPIYSGYQIPPTSWIAILTLVL